MANMYFLSRFIVMVVLESFGQLVSGSRRDVCWNWLSDLRA